jgi:hypothetical protein
MSTVVSEGRDTIYRRHPTLLQQNQKSPIKDMCQLKGTLLMFRRVTEVNRV